MTLSGKSGLTPRCAILEWYHKGLTCQAENAHPLHFVLFAIDTEVVGDGWGLTHATGKI